MSKSKVEAERDLLAKNHRRLNKEINALLDENKSLRKKLLQSEAEVQALLDKMQRMKIAEYKDMLKTAVHALAGNFTLTSQQVAERAHAVATYVQVSMPDNDNGS